MGWFENLMMGGGIAHSLLVIALVIAVGTLLGKVKVAGISLGVTWVLFAGIAASHFGMTLESEVQHFVKEFGLILFIFALGLQVGPGFFASFKKGGLSLVGYAVAIVALGVGTTALISIVTGTPISTMAGVMSGAITNTPGLGAAQTAYGDMHQGAVDPSIANGYAVAYPIGAVGVIVCMLLFKSVFKVKLDGETAALVAESGDAHHTERLSILLTNSNLYGRTVEEARGLLARNFVLSRVRHEGGGVEIASAETVLHEGDKLLIISDEADRDAIMAFFGVPTTDLKAGDWVRLETQFVPRSVIVTKSNINGKSLSALKLRGTFGVNVTRVARAGIELVAAPELELQVGDKLTVVGTEEAVAAAAAFVGNSVKNLNHPNLIAIFVGITLGVLAGSVPFFVPGMPEPLKLGLAGGPLIVAILIGRFGPRYKLVTYTTMSANLMLREVGISLFLACVGLGAGETFVESIAGGGYRWVMYGALITIVPILLIAIPARIWGRMNYFRLIGLMAGSHTNPMALSYANSLGGNDQASVAYSTVYPFTMFLRILAAQVLVMMAI
ncbi:MAG: putative transporter [Alistipes sp.]|jgi:putative transport protein|nr:putative transporter [Alistipes sp.]